MIGAILSSAGGLAQGIGTLAGGLTQGIGTFVGGLTQGIGTLAGGITQGIGTVIGKTPEIISTIKPGVELWSQWTRKRAEEKMFSDVTELERERLEAEKRIALQRLLLSSQQTTVSPYPMSPTEPITPATIQVAPAQAVSPRQDDTFFIILALAVIGILLFYKK